VTIDPDNPVVRLCSRGVEAETAGQLDDARAAYEQAWTTAADDYEACIAAHYLARVQRDHAERIHWNRVAVERAEAVGDDRVAGFHASLALNLGSAHEDASQPDAAREWYRRARTSLDSLPAGAYRETVERGVTNAERRMREAAARRS
jgi:tetratricopeptide (TPR) repeat protein